MPINTPTIRANLFKGAELLDKVDTILANITGKEEVPRLSSLVSGFIGGLALNYTGDSLVDVLLNNLNSG